MLVSKNNLNNNRGILQLKHYPIPTNIAAAVVHLPEYSAHPVPPVMTPNLARRLSQ